jgi:hypothetical protein
MKRYSAKLMKLKGLFKTILKSNGFRRVSKDLGVCLDHWYAYATVQSMNNVLDSHGRNTRDPFDFDDGAIDNFYEQLNDQDVFEIIFDDINDDGIGRASSSHRKFYTFMREYFNQAVALGEIDQDEFADFVTSFIEYLSKANVLQRLKSDYVPDVYDHYYKQYGDYTTGDFEQYYGVGEPSSFQQTDTGSDELPFGDNKKASMVRTAGEVRFVKDKSEGGQWAWADTGASERNIPTDYNYNPKKRKALAKVLRSTSASLGHALSAYSTFTKIKSADVSPDGCLGGKGYVFKIPEMRKAFMNAVEAFSALSDTLYDEVSAPHWSAVSRQETDEEKAEVDQIVSEAEEIREDPQDWAEEQEEQMDSEMPKGKTARRKQASARQTIAQRVASLYLAQKNMGEY